MSPGIAEIQSTVRDVLRRRGVVRASVFGSVARGEDSAGSDVDFLVEFEPGRSLVDLAGLRLDLAEVLDRDVDEAADLLKLYTADLTFDAFSANVEKQDSVARRLEIIGEAVKLLPEELRARYPEIPWRDIAGARDVLIQEYFRIDLDLAWEMVQDDVPTLAATVARMLRDLADPEGEPHESAGDVEV